MSARSPVKPPHPSPADTDQKGAELALRDICELPGNLPPEDGAKGRIAPEEDSSASPLLSGLFVKGLKSWPVPGDYRVHEPQVQRI
jgi:hypothetical protein